MPGTKCESDRKLAGGPKRDSHLRHFLEQRNLADGGGRNALIVALQQNLLQGHNLARLLVAGLEHHSVGALPEKRELSAPKHGSHTASDEKEGKKDRQGLFDPSNAVSWAGTERGSE